MSDAPQRKCPIIVVLDEIAMTGAGDTAINTAIIGSGDNACEFAYDGAEYMMNTDKIAVARHEAKSSPDHGEVAARLFGDVSDTDLISEYSRLFPRICDAGHLSTQIGEFIAMMPKLAKKFNGSMTIPDLEIVSDIAASMRPDVLQYQLEKFREFMIAIGANFAKNPFLKIKKPNIIIEKFPNNIAFSTGAKSLEDVKQLLAHKIALLTYMQSVEKAICDATGYINYLINLIRAQL